MNIRAGAHPSSETLQAFALGKIDDDRAESLAAHVANCPTCQKAAAAMSSDGFLDRLRAAHSRGGTAAPAKPLSGIAPQSRQHADSPSPTPLPVPGLPPELVNHPQYEIIRELGRGGMGVVYLARNKLLARLEVLKVVNKAILEQPGVADRFLREIQSAALLNHANVVTAYSALPLGGSLAFAMEYVEGEDLAKLVKARGPLPVAYSCYCAREAALGLQHAYEKKMVHRDIKPQNLILARDGAKHIVKVLDFGLAKVLREGGSQRELTGSGVMMGTPDYMAPEQTLDAAHADIRADIYSLGCTLYFLLTGAAPFKGNSLYEILQAHHSMEAKALNLVRAEIPAELADVVRTMMAKAPEQRYQTPGEAARALAPFIKQKASGIPTGASQLPAPQPAAVPAVPPSPLTARGGDSLKKVGSPSVEVRKAPFAQQTLLPKASAKKWLLGGVAVGVALLTLVALLGLVGLWAAGVFKVKTKDGTIVLENLPPDADVTVDGGTVSVKSGDGKTFEVRVSADKKHRLEVNKDGFKMFGEEVEVDVGGRKSVIVQLVPKESSADGGPTKDPVEKELPKTVTVDLGGGVKMEFVLIPKGTFQMGSPKDEAERNRFENDFDAEKQHEVEITKPFYLAKYPVTQEQYQAITGKNPSFFSATGGGKERVAELNTEQFPVESVTWHDAKACCVELTQKDKQGHRFRLPTEAECEYACRAGTQTTYFFGDNPKNLGDYAWFADNSGGRTHQVGGKKPNAWGLHDMYGNVLQWCEDYYGPYEGLNAKDPLRSIKHSEERRVVRGGGSWFSSVDGCRAAYRFRDAPDNRDDFIGFRMAFDAPAKPKKADMTSVSPVSPPQTQNDKGFVPLFNGKDLTGWKTHPDNAGDWRVEQGIMVGRGPVRSLLFTERDDYQNFHLLVEARINSGGDSGVCFRLPLFDYRKSQVQGKGYEAQINNTAGKGNYPVTGSLMHFPGMAITERLIAPGEWFALEVIADGYHVIIKTNGEKTVDFIDPDKTYHRGHIAVQVLDPSTVVEFRKIEIKELPLGK